MVLNEKWQIQMTDFGTAKKQIVSDISSCSASVSAYSGISSISGISKMSNISGISAMECVNSINEDNKRILEEDIIGSEYYVSPEMLEKREWSYSTDLWGLGIIIYQMLTGNLPFKGKS